MNNSSNFIAASRHIPELPKAENYRLNLTCLVTLLTKRQGNPSIDIKRDP
jgi:hypothetical protein